MQIKSTALIDYLTRLLSIHALHIDGCAGGGREGGGGKMKKHAVSRYKADFAHSALETTTPGSFLLSLNISNIIERNFSFYISFFVYHDDRNIWFALCCVTDDTAYYIDTPHPIDFTVGDLNTHLHHYPLTDADADAGNYQISFTLQEGSPFSLTEATRPNPDSYPPTYTTQLVLNERLNWSKAQSYDLTITAEVRVGEAMVSKL